MNVDAGFDPDTGSGSTGAGIRDERGHFLSASNHRLGVVLDAQTAEAEAVRQGLHLTNQLGCQKLCIQSDCMEVTNTLKDGGFLPTAAAPLLKDICVQATTITKFMYVFCPRNANLVTHT